MKFINVRRILLGVLLPIVADLIVFPAFGADADPIYTLCDIMKAPGKFGRSTIRIRARIGRGAVLYDDRCKSTLPVETPMVVVDDTIFPLERAIQAGSEGSIDVSGQLEWKGSGSIHDVAFMISHVWSLTEKRS
jgi:hypothetical protein